DVAGDCPAVVAQEALVGLVGDEGAAFEEIHVRFRWQSSATLPERQAVGKGCHVRKPHWQDCALHINCRDDIPWGAAGPACPCSERSMPVAQAKADPAGDLVTLAEQAAAAAEALLADATLEVRARVTADGRTSGRLIDREQRAAHGLAWLATYVQALRQ